MIWAHDLGNLYFPRDTMEYPHDQWEIQDPEMEVLYHFSGHLWWGISPYIDIALT